MTEMPIEHAAHAAVHPAPHPAGVAARLRELIPELAVLAARPRPVDALVRALKANVPDAEMEGLIAGLHGLAHKHEGLARQGSGPQPVVSPAMASAVTTAIIAQDRDHDHDRSM